MHEEAPNVGKTRLTITEAANLAGVNRTYFYQKYITPWLVTPHEDERGKKYIELSELLFATGPLLKKIPNDQTRKKNYQTTDTTRSDNTDNQVDIQVLKAKIEGLEASLKAKDEIVRIKDDQLRQSEAREIFYQDELRAVRLLIAPIQTTGEKTAPKRKKWLWIF